MEHSQQTIQQVDRAIERTIQKFPPTDAPTVFTDIHFRVVQDSGELLSFDDDDNEVNRCVVEGWIGNTDDSFCRQVAALLRKRLSLFGDRIDLMGIVKPFSFILEDDERTHIAELYLADDDTIIIGGDIMENLGSDLDGFLEELMKG